MTQDINDQGSSGVTSRKVHKADREKLRRDKLNEQFAELAAVLDPVKPKLDKASILGDSLQVVKDLRVEIKRLRAERGTLVDESRDLKREMGDLEEEKATLQKQTDAMEVQVHQLLRSAAPPPCVKQAAPVPGLPPAFSFPPRYAPATFHLGPRPSLTDSINNNPFVYLTSPSCAARVERPCAQYPCADFLSKVQTNLGSGFQAPVTPDKRRDGADDEQECVGVRDGESDVQLHLGQPRSRHEIDTDLHLQLTSASSSSEKGASLCPS